MPSEHRQLQLARSWCHSRSSGGPWVQSSPSKGKYWRVCSQADFQVVAGGLANQPPKGSHRPISTKTAKNAFATGIKLCFCATAAPLWIKCGAASSTTPRRARNQPNREIKIADGPDQYWWFAMMNTPPSKSMAPVIHTSMGLSKKDATSEPIFGILTATMAAMMERKGPMTRAKDRVRALDSGVAGIGGLPSVQ